MPAWPAPRAVFGLRGRLALALMSVALIACLGFTWAMHEFVETLEVELQGDAAQRGLSSLIVEHDHGIDVSRLTDVPGRVFARAPGDKDTTLPGALAGLAAGDHRVVRYQGATYYAARRDAGDGTALYLMLDVEGISAIENLEDELAVIGVVTLAVTLLVALLIAAGLSFLILRPVHHLSQRLGAYRPGQSNPPIAGDYDDRDMRDIAASFDTLLGRFDVVIARERAFTQDASHELRTPLAVAMGASELLQAMPDLPERARLRADRMRSACERMHRLVAALMMLAREPGTPHPTTCDAADVLEQVLDFHRDEAADRQIALITHVAPTPLALPDGVIDCVLHNLVENAIRHTENAPIEITVIPQMIRVADQGTGLSLDARDHIFEREYRTADSPGLGIGLYLVSRICERMGWPITADSVPDMGTTIEIRLVPA